MDNTEKEARRSRQLLEAARAAWERMAPARSRRRRYCRYTYGEQWSDPVRSFEGGITTEGELARESGQQPLTNNLIRRLVKAVIGRFRMERAALSAEERARADPDGLNRLDELDARTLEEFLISGMAIHRVCRERRRDGYGRWADNIPPDRFFINRFRDPRGGDIELAGCLHDMSAGEVAMRFSAGSPRRAEQLRKLYGAIGDASPGVFAAGEEEEVSFGHAAAGRCRVIEIWALESRERYRCHDPLAATFRYLDPADAAGARRENARRKRRGLAQMELRWEIAPVWRCRMMAPDGTVLDSYDSPLADGSLPLAVKMYPLVDGEVHSLVEDVIGQQKHVNRLITLMDHIMGVSAKGVLMFPLHCKLEELSWSTIAKMWATPGAVLPYRPFDGEQPHQVSAPAGDIGAREMLRTQIELFEEVSGVSSTLMGKNISGAVGAARYESELKNSAVSILDLLKSFADFTDRRDRLLALA